MPSRGSALLARSYVALVSEFEPPAALHEEQRGFFGLNELFCACSHPSHARLTLFSFLPVTTTLSLTDEIGRVWALSVLEPANSGSDLVLNRLGLSKLSLSPVVLTTFETGAKTTGPFTLKAISPFVGRA